MKRPSLCLETIPSNGTTTTNSALSSPATVSASTPISITTTNSNTFNNVCSNNLSINHPPAKRRRIESVQQPALNTVHTLNPNHQVTIPRSTALVNPENGLITLVNIPPAVNSITSTPRSSNGLNIPSLNNHGPAYNNKSQQQQPQINNSQINGGNININGSTKSVPKISTYNIRKNELISDSEANPLVNIHKIPLIRDITESIRLYGKMNKFCIGKETRNLKKIYVTSQSPTAGLCSKHIDKGIMLKGTKYELPSLKFCLMNYKCDCQRAMDLHQGNNGGINLMFTIPLQWRSYILNCNFPSSIFSIEINDKIIGYFFVKTSAPSNLKRMAQPSTFPQFRMSISESVALSSKEYPGLEFFISKLNQSPMAMNGNNPHKMNMGQCHTNDNEEFPVSYAVGMGYYYTGRMRNILDLILCMTNVNDTKFTVRADPNISKKIQSIRFKMHIEQSTSDILLFEYLSSSHQPQSTHITPTMETTSPSTGNTSVQLSLPPISGIPQFNMNMNRMQMAQQQTQNLQNGSTAATAQQQMSQCTLHSPHSNASHTNVINGQQVVAARNVNGNVSNVSYQNHTQTQSQMQSIPLPPIPLNTMNMNSMNMKPVNFINTNEASHTSQSTLPLKAVVATHAHTTQPQQPQTQTVIIPACNGVTNGTVQTRPVYYATTTGNIAQAPTQTLPAGSYQIVSQNTANTTNVTNVSSHQQMHHQTQNIQNMGIQQQVHVLNTNTINNSQQMQHHVNHVNNNNYVQTYKML